MSKTKTAKSEGKGDRKEKKHKKKKDDGASKDSKKAEKIVDAVSTTPGFSLLADEERVNPALSSLFAAKPTPPVRGIQIRRPIRQDALARPDIGPEDDDEDVSDIGIEHGESFLENEHDTGEEETINKAVSSNSDIPTPRKRRRKHDTEEIEDVYMRRLAREEAKEAPASSSAATPIERESKRLKTATTSTEGAEEPNSDVEADSQSAIDSDDALNTDTQNDDPETELSPPPLHETQQQPNNASTAAEKATRTVFLANVSTEAITSKSARKTLLAHLKSIIPATNADVSQQQKQQQRHEKLESLRFRSTPYTPHIPKRAAFARRALVPATAHSTNAYAVYSHPSLAREAVRKLNGTVILDRHLRVDGVAEPAAKVGRRGVFVGNLGFVDEETPDNDGDATGEKAKKKAKPAADAEEGLWRVFARCGVVESVRVVRDGLTRVGKGFAYVAFAEQEAVEAALALDGRAFPPLLPRKLRVRRVKKGGDGTKRGAVGEGAPRHRSSRRDEAGGRRGGRDGDALRQRGTGGARGETGSRDRERKRDGIPPGFAKPESFVFEGHRASSKSGKAGLKLGRKKSKKGVKPTNRSARRGAAFKAGQQTKGRKG